MLSKIFFLLVTVCIVNASVLTGNVFDEDPKDEVASNPKDCSPQACEQLCRRLKFPAGACVNGRCKCDNFLNVEGKREAEVLADPRRCRDRVCNWLCRALNNTSGACVDGRCRCTKSVVVEDAGDENSDLDERRVCRITKCNQTCTRRGYEGAKCINGRCKCYNKIQKVGEIPETSLPVSELAEDQNERGCNPKACDQLCRRLKFTGGACVNGRCKCDNIFRVEGSITIA